MGFSLIFGSLLLTFRTKSPQKVCLCWVSLLPQKKRKDAWVQFSISITSKLCFIASEQMITVQHRGKGIDVRASEHIGPKAYVRFFLSFASDSYPNRGEQMAFRVLAKSNCMQLPSVMESLPFFTPLFR